jgi:hypothetical protein
MENDRHYESDDGKQKQKLLSIETLITHDLFFSDLEEFFTVFPFSRFLRVITFPHFAFVLFRLLRTFRPLFPSDDF